MSYKLVRIGKYDKSNGERIVSIDLEELRTIIESDPCLYWYEDVDTKFRERQKKRDNPNIKMSFVFNYKPNPSNPDFNAGFINGTDDIIIRVFDNYERSIVKLEEITNKLNAKIYE